ncbi:hypothetical protein CANCADRAFT_33052 [Tortispora caseinolytica NRRL Y-17796]|uniref:Dihydroxy-acid dehydratase n=1 Tax=Tortispora caseinolytica NRRL Y-17796 TaxID=767744 RepID=A0A1E4T9N2_9ASCO|nr:hypothetical protein CANCADRAFT_33052 [Tortispora caseinolytica NRRL Y-17796]
MACEGCNCGKAEQEAKEIAQLSPEELKARLEEAEKRAASAEKLLRELQRAEANGSTNGKVHRQYRSKIWFDNKEDPSATALHIERYLNFGLTREELKSGKPIIGIAQTGSDLSPCNRHHLELAKRVREGIRTAGGVCLEFPVHPIQETGKRPGPALDRNLAYLGLVELLFGYPIDGVVLLTGCDKTTPACLMAACTLNIPAIVMNVGPMLNGYYNGELAGSGTAIWKARELHATGAITTEQFSEIAEGSAPSVGHCNTMGTASTMNAMAEALGMALPGSATIPAPYRDRGECAYLTGLRIVELTEQNIRPSDILVREAFENAIVANTAIGGSTNAPIHVNAIAKCIGVPLNNDDWERVGYHVPLLLNIQPAGEYLCEEYYRAGGLPAIMAELFANGIGHPNAMTVNGKTIGENCIGKFSTDRRVIKPYNEPMVASAGFLNLKGTLFDSAIMKTCVISDEFRKRYLSNPNDPNAFEGPVVVFDGPEDYHANIEKLPEIDEHTILLIRGAGPIGYPGAAEVVNMQPPARLLKQNVTSLPCIGDGRQSGTSGSPSILNASPEAALSQGLAILKNGDRLRIDLNKRSADILLPKEEIERRKQELMKNGGYKIPESQTPWQEIYRDTVEQLDAGMAPKSVDRYRNIAERFIPRDSH